MSLSLLYSIIAECNYLLFYPINIFGFTVCLFGFLIFGFVAFLVLLLFYGVMK